MTKVQHAVAALLEEHGVAAVATALWREMAGAGVVTGLTTDEVLEWNATLAKLEELAQRIGVEESP